MIRQFNADENRAGRDVITDFKFTNHGGPLPLPAPARSAADRTDQLPSPQNGWRRLFKTVHPVVVDTVNALLPEIDERNHLSDWAHANARVLSVARAVHQCENVERMAAERFNQLLGCARRIVGPHEDKEHEDILLTMPRYSAADLKIVEADLKLLDAMGRMRRKRLIYGYLISRSSHDTRVIDLIGSPLFGFTDDEMEFIRLLSVPDKAFVPLLAPQIETIIANIGPIDESFYKMIRIPICGDDGTTWDDHRKWLRDGLLRYL